ncbi:COQ9 family protein [Glacieibacterium megasporae]|uniref:COQ9 family protein n=1 Tax=Glacieibacterium megasporae TaxID=2835787 RepID=UPI001C1E8D17|nr:COQ9 family protein [Polymorphobacter megasporae]UAJ10251.1 COQ9 family protein [Polymorphobacter megasporae]
MTDEIARPDETLDETRPRLIAAMIPHVAFDGWTAASVAAAAADAGIDPDVAHLVFPRGAAQMVDAYTAYANTRMTAALTGIGNMKVRERIAFAVRTRFEQAEGERETVRRAVAIFALHPALSAKSTWRTADAIWHACGDTATDFNHYSKRAILGGVYAATLMYWLGDESDSRADTWGFLDRRIAGIMSFEKTRARLTSGSGNRPSIAQILGRLRYPAV